MTGPGETRGPAVNLVDKYRPRLLADVCGQDDAIGGLRLWLQAPASGAMIFEGGTGSGKTSAALALARELGVEVEQDCFGGLFQIASGEQDAASVRALARSLEHWPMMGSGWRVAIVNEADQATPGAANVWLDVLESLPARCLVIFTTNNVDSMPARWRDRCEVVSFQSSYIMLKPEADRFIAEVWQKETGGPETPKLDDLAGVVEDGEVSFRRILQKLQPYVRAGKAPESVAPAVAAAKRAWETKRRKAAMEA